MQEFQPKTCPLCMEQGTAIQSFKGAYDHDRDHVGFCRVFYRCDNLDCGAVFFLEMQMFRKPDLEWEEELDECHRSFQSLHQELTESEPYQRMLQGKEVKDRTITGNTQLRNEVRLINQRLAEEQEKVETFHQRLRNFSWDDLDAISAWVEENHLPPNFSEKELEIHFRMCLPSLRPDGPDKPYKGPLQLTQGQKVLHRLWGNGCVVTGNPNGGNQVTVEFRAQGKKTLDLRYAQLSLNA